MSTAEPNYALVVATLLPGGLRVGVVLKAQQVVSVDLLPAQVPLRSGHSAIERRFEREILAYFEDASESFDIPLRASGTPFQLRVWQALLAIPVGTTVSYGELAAKLSSAPRAVAAACRANPIPLLVPCHRVVGKRGLGGFMGTTTGPALEVKRWLLHHEGAL